MKRAGLLIALLVVLATMTPAFSAVLIDFGTGSAGLGGTITISGGNAIGTGIPVDTLTISGAPVNNGVFDTQGTVVSGTAVGGNSAALSFNTNTGAISIVGGVSALGVPLGTTLLSGTIQSFSLTNGGTLGSITASGTDTKSPLLLAALGLPTSTPFAFFGFSIGFNQAGTGGTYTANSTDIANTSVPEPASVVLFGSLLLGTGLAIRRKVERS